MSLITLSQKLRANPTRAEIHLWLRLKKQQLGVRFRRQQPIDQYIVDFFCSECRLVVEVDGGQHNTQIDEERDHYLRNQNLQILRFWNNDVLNNIDEVVLAIKRVVDMSPPPGSFYSPTSPVKGGGFLKLNLQQ